VWGVEGWRSRLCSFRAWELGNPAAGLPDRGR
jgi:hypothetical protein